MGYDAASPLRIEVADREAGAAKLLVHHHASAFEDSQGIWLPAFIGRWVQELAAYWQQVGLLLHETSEKYTLQDSCVIADNVILHRLGPPGRTWDRIQRIRRIKGVCRNVSPQYDWLLIRGITPRQLTVWRECAIAKKAYLLVGSLKESKPRWGLGASQLYSFFMWHHRLRELRNIAGSADQFLVNSPMPGMDVRGVLNRAAALAPTNTLRKAEFCDFEVRPLSGSNKILYCGRVVPDKGVLEILDAMHQLQTEKLICHLDIVGPMPASFVHIFYERIHRYGLSNFVTHRGFVPFGKELFEFYRQADVFVLPSHHEGFPKSLWEAAANCCPIVATNVGGVGGFLRKGSHALLIQPRNAGAIAAALRRILTNPKLRRTVIQNAYQLAQHYTVESCAHLLSQQLLNHVASSVPPDPL